MPFIGKQPQAGAYSKLDSITTSATATYNLTLDSGAYYPQSANHLLVSLNGVIQAPQDSFTVSGSQIIFDSALTNADVIDFIIALGDTLDIGVPSAGSVNTSQLANDAVTTAKIAAGQVTSAKLDTNIGIGTVNAPSNKNTVTPTLNVLGSGVNGAAQITRHTSVGGGGALIHLAATRGNDVNSYTILQSGDGIGTVAFQAADGNEFVTAAQIVANVDGTPGDNDMPARLTFSVTEDGNSSPTERMRIHNGGVVSFSNGIELGSGLDATAANVLDDYEEGTWTGSVGAVYGFTPGASATFNGNYVKIGDQLTVNCSINFDTSETLALGDRFIIQGIPFITTGSVNGIGGGSFIQPGSFASGTHAVGTVATNSQSQDEAMCVVTRVNGTPPALNNTNVNIGITYKLTNTF